MAVKPVYTNQIVKPKIPSIQKQQPMYQAMKSKMQTIKPTSNSMNATQAKTTSVSTPPKYGYGYGNGATSSPGFTDKNAEIQRTIDVIKNRQGAGMDLTHQLSHYKNLTGKSFDQNLLNSMSRKLEGTQPQAPVTSPMPQTQTNPLLQRDLGLGNKVNLGFNDWDNYNAVMEQLDSSAIALGQLNRDNSLNMSDVSDIYEHYLKSAARAQELGYEGITAPMIMTGFAKPDDPRWQNFRSAEERGFDPYAPINKQWEGYLGTLGTQKKANQEQMTYNQLLYQTMMKDMFDQVMKG